MDQLRLAVRDSRSSSKSDSDTLFAHTTGGENYMKELEAGAIDVKNAVYQAAERLENTNNEISKLRKMISKNIEVPDGDNAKVPKAKPKKDAAENTSGW